ncbi:MAG: AI-2E family transporter [Chloroflexota bacterium]|nr:AI-2E family transporter [Chloroflexota bacterium]
MQATADQVQAQAEHDEQQPKDLHVAVEVNRLKIPGVVGATLGVLGVLLLAYLTYKALPLLLLFLMSLLIATAIEPLVNRLRHGPFNRSAGILVVYTALFLILGLILYVIGTTFVSQLGDLGTSIHTTVGKMQSDVKSIQSPFLQGQINTILKVADNFVTGFQKPPSTPATVDTVTQTILPVAEAFFGVITIFVVAFYWLTERILIKRAVMTWFPARRANRIRRVWDDIEVKVGGWVRGQLTLMALVGLISAVGYFFIGVHYWPVLALFIAIAEAIPLVGPYIGTAPAVVVALTQEGDGGIGKALMVMAFAVLLQTVEGNVLVPRIMRNSVGISPLTVIISILLGGTLAGLAGALLAVPLAGALQVIITDIKAARESEEKLAEQTLASEETRREDSELVVAYPKGESETGAKVESGAKV